MKYLLGIFMAIFLAVGCIWAEEAAVDVQPVEDIQWDLPVVNAGDPNELVQVKWTSVVNVLQAEYLDIEQKEQIIDKIIDPIFDYSLMSKLALGKKNWFKLSAEQREEYAKLFIVMLKSSYREKIASYKKQQTIFKPGQKDKSTFKVPMELASDDMKLTILYKLRWVKDCWKIYDLEIQGVSILLTYRSQFDDILSHSSVEDFLGQLEKTGNTQS